MQIAKKTEKIFNRLEIEFELLFPFDNSAFITPNVITSVASFWYSELMVVKHLSLRTPR